MKQVKLSSQVISPLHPILSDKQLEGVEDVIITSGRSGSKSSASAINTAYRALSKPSAHIVMRKHKNKLRQTVFTETKRAFTRLGISERRSLNVKVSPYHIEVKKNGSSIYFTGSDNPDDTKGMIDDKFPIETVTIDEVNEFFAMGYERGKEEIDNIKATFVRGNDSDFKMFYMFNPPKNPNAPVMRWLNEIKYLYDDNGNNIGLNPRTRHIHVTYLDVPVEWNKQKLYDSTLETKRLDEEYYNWLWLGQSIGVKDVIFHMFNKDKHVIDYKGEPLVNIGIGVDYGQMNATTFNAFGIDRQDKKLRGIQSYEHSGRDTGRQKTPSEYANDILDFVKQVEDKTGSRVSFITIDPSAKGFAEEVKRVLRNNRYNIPIRSAKNDVAEGIARTQVLLYNDIMTIDSSMKGVIDEFNLYSYDERSIERGDEKPIKDNDHHMDSIRYLVMEQYKHIKGYIKTEEGAE